jgi:hypothetical protein
MKLDIEAILKSLGERDALWGIGTAARDIGGLLPCFGQGESALCPTKIFNLASGDLWQKEIAEAASRLTWGDEDMRIKSLRDGSDLPDGAILMFDGILSSSNLDRDGDVLESKGLAIDVDMPLLWHHIKLQPIGRHVKLLDQNDKWVKCQFAIADTELGRDAAVLTRMKALRMSHGFIPSDFEPRGFKKGLNGQQIPIGWHVKKANVYEGTLCSIPANSDGRVLDVYAGEGSVWATKEFDGLATAHSRGMLQHEMVKAWAKNIFDQRPTQVSGADLAGKMLADDDTSGGTEATPPETTATAKKRRKKKRPGGCPGMKPDGTCDCNKNKSSEISLETKGKLRAVGQSLIDLANFDPSEVPVYRKSLDALVAKSSGELSTKGMYGIMDDYLEGSFEWVAHKLRRTAVSHLCASGATDLPSYDDGASMVATFADSAIFCIYHGGKHACYRSSWAMNDAGLPAWTGTPEAVEIKPQVVTKALASLGAPLAPIASDSLEQLTRKTCAALFMADEEAAALAGSALLDAIKTVEQQLEPLEPLLN